MRNQQDCQFTRQMWTLTWQIQLIQLNYLLFSKRHHSIKDTCTKYKCATEKRTESTPKEWYYGNSVRRHEQLCIKHFILKYMSTHIQYPAALFQYGLSSTEVLSCCTKSTNKQQHGASMVIIMKPVTICHIPINKQETLPSSMPIQFHNPMRMETEQR